jgi:hypothetical protein
VEQHAAARNRFDWPIEQWETISRLLRTHLASAASLYSQIEYPGWDVDKTEAHELDQLLGVASEDMLQHVIVISDLIVLASGGNFRSAARFGSEAEYGAPFPNPGSVICVDVV